MGLRAVWSRWPQGSVAGLEGRASAGRKGIAGCISPQSSQASPKLLARQRESKLGVGQVATSLAFPRSFLQAPLEFSVAFLQQGIHEIVDILILVRMLFDIVLDAEEDPHRKIAPQNDEAFVVAKRLQDTTQLRLERVGGQRLGHSSSAF